MRAGVNPRRHFVLDPMCGSGSTLVAATQSGFDSLGLDIMPYSILFLVSLALLRPITIALFRCLIRDPSNNPSCNCEWLLLLPLSVPRNHSSQLKARVCKTRNNQMNLQRAEKKSLLQAVYLFELLGGLKNFNRVARPDSFSGFLKL